MPGAGITLVVFLLAAVAPFILYYLVRTEHTQRTTMDRETAEQTARKDTPDRSDPDASVLNGHDGNTGQLEEPKADIETQARDLEDAGRKE